MKRKFALLLALCLLFSVAVQADVIWEPDDDFYWKHSDECDHYGRSHIINSPDGYLELLNKPEGSVVTTAQNGEAYYIHFTYADGKWGLVEFDDGSTVWLQMDKTVLKYDNSSFLEEYAAAFYEDDGALEEMLQNLTEEDPVYEYSYPGVGKTGSYIPAKYLLEDENFNLRNLFLDENGLVWGYVGYFMGHRGWICLSDPTNDSLPAVQRQSIELYPASVPATGALSNDGVVAVCMVSGVALVSLTLIFVIRRKKVTKG